MKQRLVILCFLAIAASVNATLSVGDIAIIEFNTDDPDSAKFVALADLAEGEVINFTDGGWYASGSFRTSEGTATYTVGTGGLSAGTVVSISVGSMQFSTSGDQILAYQGSASSPTMIYALNGEGSGWQSDCTSSNTSALPAGLVDGETAIALPEYDNYVYNGITTGTKSELLAAISDTSNWVSSNTTRQTYSGGDFTVIPEPATMALLGLGAMILFRKK